MRKGSQCTFLAQTAEKWQSTEGCKAHRERECFGILYRRVLYWCIQCWAMHQHNTSGEGNHPQSRGSRWQSHLSENSPAQAEWRYITQCEAVRKPEQAIQPSQRRDVTSVSVYFIIKAMMDKYEIVSNSKTAPDCERSEIISFQESKLI